MRQVAAIFGGKGGTVKTNAQNSPEMDAIILTRWAKRRLPALRAARELRLDQIQLEEAQKETHQEESKKQNGSTFKSSYVDDNSINQFVAGDDN